MMFRSLVTFVHFNSNINIAIASRVMQCTIRGRGGGTLAHAAVQPRLHMLGITTSHNAMRLLGAYSLTLSPSFPFFLCLPNANKVDIPRLWVRNDNSSSQRVQWPFIPLSIAGELSRTSGTWSWIVELHVEVASGIEEQEMDGW